MKLRWTGAPGVVGACGNPGSHIVIEHAVVGPDATFPASERHAAFFKSLGSGHASSTKLRKSSFNHGLHG